MRHTFLNRVLLFGVRLPVISKQSIDTRIRFLLAGRCNLNGKERKREYETEYHKRKVNSEAGYYEEKKS